MIFLFLILTPSPLSAVQTSGCWKRKALQTSVTPPAHNSGATSHTTSPPHSGLTTPPKNSGLLEQRRKLMSFENPWEIEIICEIDVKWKGGRGKRKLFPGWSFLMRGAKRGLEAGLTGNKAWSFPHFDCKRKKSKCRLLLRGRSHNQLTVQGKPKSPTNSGDVSVQVRSIDLAKSRCVWNCIFVLLGSQKATSVESIQIL